ncbi:hypothetical protein PCH_Pc21g22780 [Penicillium rubens Wisconsin 54-1255]|uniref:Uncharacterized protein n=1 Tax=Penicillium rubens (strain ATCC 28089 / DSM 1075 / NRRL 1951 / Wisconsin 54-1255) TaxID=500485 RepID=B6HNY0_PENRW|nr:hypothetical protein PCH_Pc21g22780 [Penicillium rubens Wisconsin 54-1255]
MVLIVRIFSVPHGTHPAHLSDSGGCFVLIVAPLLLPRNEWGWTLYWPVVADLVVQPTHSHGHMDIRTHVLSGREYMLDSEYQKSMIGSLDTSPYGDPACFGGETLRRLPYMRTENSWN